MGKKKSKTESSHSSSSVVTPTNPQWVQDTAANLNSGIQGLSGIDPYSLVAPASELERSAAQGAVKLGQGFGGGSQPVGGDSWFANLLPKPPLQSPPPACSTISRTTIIPTAPRSRMRPWPISTSMRGAPVPRRI